MQSRQILCNLEVELNELEIFQRYLTNHVMKTDRARSEQQAAILACMCKGLSVHIVLIFKY